MKKIIIALLLISILLSGCQFLDRTICFEHDEINMERTTNNKWEINAGLFRVHMYLCDEEEINNTSNEVS